MKLSVMVIILILSTVILVVGLSSNPAHALADPNTCGEEGTIYLVGDLNHDCYIDLKDISILAESWLSCTDPADPTCN